MRRRSLAIQRGSTDQLDLSGWAARQQVGTVGSCKVPAGLWARAHVRARVRVRVSRVRASGRACADAFRMRLRVLLV